MYLSTAFSFLEVSIPTTGMVLPFRRMVVYCCTGSVQASEAVMVAMLGFDGYVEAGVGAKAGRRA